MTFTNPPLAGHLAFVTGSARGIGRAIALELADWGADVVVHALKNGGLAEEVAGAIRGKGRRSMSILADIRDREAMSACADRVKAELGVVDILVNNAGTRKDGHFILMAQASWDEVMDVNLGGCVNATQAFVRGMMAQRWGRVINLVSPSAILGMPGQANYGASKGAIIGLTRNLARELRALRRAGQRRQSGPHRHGTHGGPLPGGEAGTCSCPPTSSAKASPRRSPPWWPSSPVPGPPTSAARS